MKKQIGKWLAKWKARHKNYHIGYSKMLILVISDRWLHR